MKRCKITAIRKTEYKDLMEQYENPMEHACDIEEGQVFIAEGWKRPEGFCESAWESISPFVMTLAYGGSDIYEGWMKNKKSAMISCNDGFRPVSFYIGRLKKLEFYFIKKYDAIYYKYGNYRRCNTDMGSYLNPGNFSFRGSLRSKIYVDKSELIAKTNEVLYTEQKYICVSRPRRFGKSMAVNMLAAYYDRSENTEELFQNLSISKDRSYKENLNQYDVIKINMQEFLSMSETVEEMLQMLKDYLVSDFKEAFREIQFRDEKNLIQVMKDVFSYTRCPFVILIDEWDCLFREYKQNKEAQKKYLDFCVHG